MVGFTVDDAAGMIIGSKEGRWNQSCMRGEELKFDCVYWRVYVEVRKRLTWRSLRPIYSGQQFHFGSHSNHRKILQNSPACCAGDASKPTY